MNADLQMYHKNIPKNKRKIGHLKGGVSLNEKSWPLVRPALVGGRIGGVEEGMSS